MSEQLSQRAMNHVHGLLAAKGLTWRNDRHAAEVLARQIANWVATHGHKLAEGEGVPV